MQSKDLEKFLIFYTKSNVTHTNMTSSWGRDKHDGQKQIVYISNAQNEVCILHRFDLIDPLI